MEPGKFERMTEVERHAIFEECFEYHEHLRINGHLAADVPLESPDTAVILYWENGRVVTTDGSHTKTRAQLADILVFEARDLNHAIQIISQHPAMKLRTNEIRPVANLSKIIKERGRRR
jgi:hypothetical protein